MKTQLNLYQGADGAFSTAGGLTPEEAVAAFKRGHLTAQDAQLLSPDAARAVLAEFDGFDCEVGERDGSVVVFGVRKPTFARHGRA